MEIQKARSGSTLTFTVIGRLDTTTAPQFETELKSSLEGVNEFDIDLNAVDYVSSAGLRVVLLAQKMMNKQGSMVVKNVRPEVLEVFEMTGFTSILNIK
ncbi:MAG: STAS domain-containing protein [Victivallaceae bacterium]|nr:STAS domain-containing protein [Victivallaceae bacterium]